MMVGFVESDTCYNIEAYMPGLNAGNRLCLVEFLVLVTLAMLTKGKGCYQSGLVKEYLTSLLGSLIPVVRFDVVFNP